MKILSSPAALAQLGERWTEDVEFSYERVKGYVNVEIFYKTKTILNYFVMVLFKTKTIY